MVRIEMILGYDPGHFFCYAMSYFVPIYVLFRFRLRTDFSYMR